MIERVFDTPSEAHEWARHPDQEEIDNMISDVMFEPYQVKKLNELYEFFEERWIVST